METNKIEQAAKMHANNAGYFHSAYVYECGFISGVKWIKTADGDDPLLGENKRLKDALNEVCEFLNVLPKLRLANKNGFDECINIEGVNKLHEMTKAVLNQSTVKEVGNNG